MTSQKVPKFTNADTLKSTLQIEATERSEYGQGETFQTKVGGPILPKLNLHTIDRENTQGL